MFEIITIPTPSDARLSRSYPFADLEVGQSFIIPADLGWRTGSVRVAAARAGKSLGKSFGVHALADGSLQVWRKS